MTALALSNPVSCIAITTADAVAAAFLAGFKPATREAYARDLRCWGHWLSAAGVDVLATHRVHVDAFAREAEDAGVAPAPLARRLTALAGVYAYALDEGLIPRSPVARVRRPNVSDESPRLGLDRGKLRAVLDAAEADGSRSAALVALLGLNGLRVSEALAADVRPRVRARPSHAEVTGKGSKLAERSTDPTHGGGRRRPRRRARGRAAVRHANRPAARAPCGTRSSAASRGRPGSARPSPLTASATRS